MPMSGNRTAAWRKSFSPGRCPVVNAFWRYEPGVGRAPISKWSSAVTKSAWRERTLPGGAPSSVATYGISTNRWAVFVGAHPRRTLQVRLAHRGHFLYGLSSRQLYRNLLCPRPVVLAFQSTFIDFSILFVC